MMPIGEFKFLLHNDYCVIGITKKDSIVIE